MQIIRGEELSLCGKEQSVEPCAQELTHSRFRFCSPKMKEIIGGSLGSMGLKKIRISCFYKSYVTFMRCVLVLGFWQETLI